MNIESQTAAKPVNLEYGTRLMSYSAQYGVTMQASEFHRELVVASKKTKYGTNNIPA